jgi:CheY-like chemotaxis protein
MASVLIVEDDRIHAEEMAETMRAAGHSVVGITVSGDQALSLAERSQPDLALVDVKLRGHTDGITLADSLQGRLGVAVVYVTGYADQAMLDRVTRVPAYGYVLKPVDRRTLEAACSMALARQQRDRADRERRRAERLEALATLAAGMAHDFNNMLAIMQNCAALAKQAAPENQRVQDLLDDLEQAGDRAAALTNQLVSFAKGGEPVRKEQTLGSIIEHSLREGLRGSATRDRMDLPPDLWAVPVDGPQIQLVFGNLVQHARCSMNNAGELSVSARNREVAAGDRLLPPGRFVEVTFHYQGPTVASLDLERIFDPFFATKTDDNGLGLASAYAIVSRHGGMLRCESLPEKGTSFQVFLPVAPAEKRDTTERLEKRLGRVLVMDDEPELRRVLSMCLEELGYEVAQTASGGEAVSAYEAAFHAGRRFDLVILDLTVRGGEGGLAALQRLRALDPKVVAIATSGYSDSDVIANHERHGFASALPKPYRFGTLVQVLRQVSPPPSEDPAT